MLYDNICKFNLKHGDCRLSFIFICALFLLIAAFWIRMSKSRDNLGMDGRKSPAPKRSPTPSGRKSPTHSTGRGSPAHAKHHDHRDDNGEGKPRSHHHHQHHRHRVRRNSSQHSDISSSVSGEANENGGNEIGGPITTTRPGISFHDVQRNRLKDIEKRMEEETRKRRKDWEKEVERMKHEFLLLYPCNKEWGSEEYIDDPYVLRRRGSIDILDYKKMKTLIMEYPDGIRRYKLRFKVGEYDHDSIAVSVENECIVVRANKDEEDGDGKTFKREHCRKIDKPAEVDNGKIRSIITSDGILIVECALPPHSLNIRKISASPSHSSHSSSQSRSPSNSPRTSQAQPKIGMPQFWGDPRERRMVLMVEIGKQFKPKEITVQVITATRFQIKAKHEERTSERFSKCKYSREFELGEKIDTYSIRGGLMDTGRLVVGALGKGYDPATKAEAGKEVAAEVQSQGTPCNVLDLSGFPPTTPQ